MLPLLLLAAVAPAAEPAPRPNVVLILTDDQGYGDLSCHGNPVLQTPNLDKLAAESVRFTQFHVSPTCAPTRAALLTGRHEFRSGVTHTIHERERLALSATTLPQWLKGAGYSTGIFGKWHLGDEDAYQPEKRGFDEVFIHGGGGIGQSYPGSCGDAPGNMYTDPALLHNGRFEKCKGYCADLFFDRAADWIAERKDQGPFYCHLATNTPHAPLQCPPEWEEPYRGKVPPDTAKFFGMVANIDHNVGRLLGRLRELGLERDTIVIFMTDNGGTAGVKLFNAGMRGAKGTPYLGGIRVPCFVRWPAGGAAPGDVDAVTAHLDWFPTLAELAGRPAAPELATEGVSLTPLLRGAKAEWPARTLFTHVGRWPQGKAAESKYLKASVRNDRFQMVSASPKGEKAWELYDVRADIGQKRNVLSQFPDEARKLEAAYDEWWDSVPAGLVNEDAVGPAVNPFRERYWRQFPEERPK